MKYPAAKKVNKVDSYHEVSISDPYQWLEDREKPETEKWIEEQGQLWNHFLSSVQGRDVIQKRLESLIYVPQIDVMPYEYSGEKPVFMGGENYFFSRIFPEKKLTVIQIRKGLHGAEKTLLDPNSDSPDGEISYQIMAVSEDGAFLVYGIRKGGEDELILQILNVKTGENLPNFFPRKRYEKVRFAPDSKTLFYMVFTDAGPRIYSRLLETDGISDKEIFGREFGPNQWIDFSLSANGEKILLTVIEGASNNYTRGIYLLNLTANKLLTIAENLEGHVCGEILENEVYLHTNWKASNGQIVKFNLDHSSPEEWKEIVPEKDNTVIVNFSIIDSHIFVNYVKNAASCIKIFDLSGKFLKELNLPTLGTVNQIWGDLNKEFAFFDFESFLHPKTIYWERLSTGEQEIWFQSNPPIHAEQMEMKQVWYKSKDETSVPMFIVHKKGISLDGGSPTLLTGYGGFNISITPYFDTPSGPFPYLFLEMGGIFALANIRGGSEFGEKWHKDGMREKKQNCFDDFISAAEWLIQNHYSSPKRLATIGASNGGLLVAAALTQRPDLFKAVICGYPVLDMLRYPKLDPLSPLWGVEFGSPEILEEFEYLLKYSPYHHVVAGVHYPAVLFITGDSDTRVSAAHARKMTARLQAATASENPILISHSMSAGHSPGGSLNAKVNGGLERLWFLKKLIFDG
jgi:prolyl oligopeptidase